MATSKKNIFVGTGFSKNDHAYMAGKEAAESAIKSAGKAPDFGLVFCSGSKYGRDKDTVTDLVKGCHDAFMEANPKCKWAGCTTGGEISPMGSTKESVVVLTITSEYTRFGIGIGENIGKNPKEAGISATKHALKDIKLNKEMDSYMQYVKTKKFGPEQLVKMNPYSIILLGKGAEKGIMPMIPKMYDIDALLQGVIEAIGTQVPIIGGGAFDDWIMKKNYTFANGEAYDEAIIVIAVFSNLYFASGLAHGFKPTKHAYFITDSGKSFGSYYVRKINGINAVDAYARDLKISAYDTKIPPVEWCKTSFRHPFGFIDPSGESWIRIPGSTMMGRLWFSMEMKQGIDYTLMNATDNDLLNATKEAAQKAVSRIKGKKPAIAIIFSCGTRNLYLGKKISKEIDIFKKYFKGVPIIGFYTFGEFGGTTGYKMGTHNESITLLVITNDLMI